jgi:DNA-binding response OmpR family regulator
MDEQRSILIVEDREPLLSAVREILEMEGYTVLVALDGTQALQVMEEVRPDLIVADILMPRMDGYAFYEATRARPEWASVPFIFLTAKAEKEDAAKAKELGVDGYIVKPFDPQKLLAAVRAQLEKAG